MRLELASSIPDAVTVLVDANEIAVESGKRINYPFRLGVIRRLKNGRFRSQVWTPAAPLPRGYPAAARATLATLIQQLEAGVRQWPTPSARDMLGHGAAATRARGDMNAEGLTFPEWMAAAGVPLPAPIDVNREQIRELVRAWQDGEDPTEHRATARSSARSSAGSGDRTGRWFVIIDKRTGHAAVRDIFTGSKAADAMLDTLGGESATGYQVMDAMWHEPSRVKLEAMGWIGRGAAEPPRVARATARGSKPGYTSCACRDCMEVAIGVPGAALCSDCEQAGCSLGDRECQSPHSYGG